MFTVKFLAHISGVCIGDICVIATHFSPTSVDLDDDAALLTLAATVAMRCGLLRERAIELVSDTRHTLLAGQQIVVAHRDGRAMVWGTACVAPLVRADAVKSDLCLFSIEPASLRPAPETADDLMVKSLVAGMRAALVEKVPA